LKIKPLGDRVLLKPQKAEEKTASGLYIPDSAKETPLTAEILAVGDGDNVSHLKIGQKVIHESFGGSEIKLAGVKHIIMDVKDILAIVE